MVSTHCSYPDLQQDRETKGFFKMFYVVERGGRLNLPTKRVQRISCITNILKVLALKRNPVLWTRRTVKTLKAYTPAGSNLWKYKLMWEVRESTALSKCFLRTWLWGKPQRWSWRSVNSLSLLKNLKAGFPSKKNEIVKGFMELVPKF